MSEPNPNIRLGIAGSGAIAIGLAKAAGPNVDTVLRARSEESAERARSRLDDNVRVVTDIGELGDRTYVVEAIAEDHDTKVALLSEINGHLAEDAVLATTTSSLSVNKLAERQRTGPEVRRAARVQPGAPDGPGRAGLPRRRRRRHPHRLRRAVRGHGQDRGRGARRARLRGQPAAVPVRLPGRGAGRGDGPQAGRHRLLHEAGRRPPDGPAGAAGLRGPGRVGRHRRAGGRRRAPARVRPDRAGPPGPQERLRASTSTTRSRRHRGRGALVGGPHDHSPGPPPHPVPPGPGGARPDPGDRRPVRAAVARAASTRTSRWAAGGSRRSPPTTPTCWPTWARCSWPRAR